MTAIEERISDRHVLKLLRAMLRAGVMEDAAVRRSISGTPQGGVISPCLCNVYLHRLDRQWATRGRGVLLRYADDLLATCKTRRDAERALEALTAILAEMGLELKQAKTRIVHLREGGEGVDFLGFHHRYVRGHTARSRHLTFLVRWPSRQAMGHARQRILHRHTGMPPIGGRQGFPRGLEIVGIFMGPLAAVLIGAEAGAGDSSAGVFRDLVVTGRSRVALFAVRVPGAVILCSLMVSAAYALLLGATFVLAGSSPLPSATTLIDGFLWSLLVDGVVCVVAVCLAAFTLSRPATITALIGLELVASPLLLQTPSLGAARKVLLDASVLKLSPALQHGAPILAESLAVTIGVMFAWVAITAGLGAWRTHRVDA
jgi:Reverse transcriptase (RNA-dependent DNA polymerase)